jgi:hypothetical protein
VPRSWKSSDVRRLIESALDGFAHEFYGGASYSLLSREDKLAVVRFMKREVQDKYSYEYMMADARARRSSKEEDR